jgi:hypothetical protein
MKLEKLPSLPLHDFPFHSYFVENLATSLASICKAIPTYFKTKTINMFSYSLEKSGTKHQFELQLYHERNSDKYQRKIDTC